jgi:hypothetical protein
MGFWKELGKTFVKASINTAIIVFTEKQLNKQIKIQISNNVIKMIILFIALLINRFSLFGQKASLFISSLIIVFLLIHSAICLIPKIVRLVKTSIRYKIIPLIPMIINGTSPSEIVTYYICSWGPLAWKIKTKFDKIAGEWVPSANDIYAIVWKYLGKNFLLFIITLGVYLVLFNLIIERLLLISMIGIARPKVYILPFSMAVDLIFKTKITQYIIS